jgi:hypothetical protein
MPEEDLVESWMYSWLIINFHTMGWTQATAKAAHKLLNKSYREIYDSLFKFIKTNEPLASWYANDRAEFKRFHYIDPNDIDRLRKLDEIMPHHNHLVMYANRDNFVSQLNVWTRNLLAGVDDIIVNDIIKLQEHYMVNFDVRDPIDVNFATNIPSYIDYDVALINKDTTYKLYNNMSWTDQADFNDKVMYRSRHGFTKRSIEGNHE